MILNPDWLKPKEKPYFHQISMDCLEKLVKCIERFNNRLVSYKPEGLGLKMPVILT